MTTKKSMLCDIGDIMEAILNLCYQYNTVEILLQPLEADH